VISALTIMICVMALFVGLLINCIQNNEIIDPLNDIKDDLKRLK